MIGFPQRGHLRAHDGAFALVLDERREQPVDVMPAPSVRRGSWRHGSNGTGQRGRLGDLLAVEVRYRGRAEDDYR
jgi:hypothetical protein